MSIFFNAVKDGTIKGLKTGIMLLKVVLPIYVIVVVIKYSPVMPFFERAFSPAMKFFNLPGNAVVPIISGVFIDEYGVVAAMSSFDFSKAAITTIAMIALTCHSLPVEAAIGKKIGYPAFVIVLYRIMMAIIIGVIIGWIGGVFL